MFYLNGMMNKYFLLFTLSGGLQIVFIEMLMTC